MRITLSKIWQGLSHPNLVKLYLSGMLRECDWQNAYNKGEYKLSYPPLRIRIEPTNKCNLRCIMCPTGQGGSDRVTGFMDMGLYEKIIDEVRHFPSPTWLILYLGGEPLLHSGLVDMIKMAKASGMYCRLNTNATLLSKNKSELLMGSGLDSIAFSFDDVTPSEYERIRRNAKYDKTLSNILGFLRLKKEKGLMHPLVTIEQVKLLNNDSKPSLEVSEHFKGLFAGYGIQNIASSYGHLWAGSFSQNAIYQYDRHKVGDGVKCQMIWSDFTINWRGDVVACCYDLRYDCILGNVRENKVADVWNNDKMVGMREMLYKGNPDKLQPCSTCSVVYGEVNKKAVV